MTLAQQVNDPRLLAEYQQERSIIENHAGYNLGEPPIGIK
jgi:hypothetical protein